MQLYTEKDVELLKNNIDNITSKIEKTTLEILEPTKEEQMNAISIVLNFIKNNKRKIYGGYAQNKLIIAKNKNDGFYEEDIIPDIDFYSPDPIVDLMKICNELYENGFKHVIGQEAQHSETYTIFSNFINVCDISYVPRNLFNRMPFIKINDINYVHPSFIMIDMYKMLSEPFFSSRRWEKTFPRIYKLQKYYPFNKVTDSIKIIDKKPKNINVDKLLNTIYNFVENNKDIIIIGNNAYNHFLEKSEILKDKKLGKKYKYLEVPYLEIVSLDYKNNCDELLKLLKNKHPEFFQFISVIEHYPFWNLLGYSCYFKYNDTIIAYIINYNRKCIPIKKVKNKINFGNKNGQKNTKNNYIQIGSFNYTLLNNIIFAIKARVNKDTERSHYHNVMTSQFVEMRNYFFKKNNKNLLDDTLFQEFIPDCIGTTMDPSRETRLIRNKRYKERKRVIFKYVPSDGVKEPTTTYRFPNSSGNPINNTKNLRIMTVEGMNLTGRVVNIDDAHQMEEQYIDDDEDLLEEIKKEELKLSQKRQRIKNKKK